MTVRSTTASDLAGMQTRGDQAIALLLVAGPTSDDEILDCVSAALAPRLDVVDSQLVGDRFVCLSYRTAAIPTDHAVAVDDDLPPGALVSVDAYRLAVTLTLRHATWVDDRLPVWLNQPALSAVPGAKTVLPEVVSSVATRGHVHA